MERVYNFGAGPATLPEWVLKQCQQALLDWQGLGMSVVEVSHRSAEFMAMMEELEQRLRALMKLPDTHHLFLSSLPARMHFSLIAENFLKTKADYICSGIWSQMAMTEAKLYGDVAVIADGATHQYLDLDLEWPYSSNADYLYYTPNETLSGLSLPFPTDAHCPVVADMTSCILSEPIDYSRYAMVIAGAQKNLAPAGLSLVVIDERFLQTNRASLPKMNDYAFQVAQCSLYATPPSFNCYAALQMCRWLMDGDRLTEIHKANVTKAALLYECLDTEGFYQACVSNPSLRSKMNVAFRLQDESLNPLFLDEAKQAGLVALKGHRKVGGMRASIYNAMPLAGVQSLVAFMQDFASRRG